MHKESTHPTSEKKPNREFARAVRYSTDPADFHYMKLNVPCQAACPASTNIPAYIRCVYEERYSRSYELNRIVNLFPGTLGRVCSRPCEARCRHGEPELGEPVNICHLKRAAADFKEVGHIYQEQLFAPLGKRVCIVGAGPAGLAAAHDLSTVGFDVTVLEALEKPGGMLRYGIPEFRLPRDVLDKEIDAIIRLGVTLKTGVRVGRDVSVAQLLKDYDAVLLAAGCYVSKELGIPGADGPGILSGLDFVMDIAQGKTPHIGNQVLVIGAGFTAFDCARLALRLGAKDVSICIRGVEQELRVTSEEIHETKREGAKIQGLMVAKRVVRVGGKLQGVEFVRTRLGDRLPNGRREIIAIDGSEFIIPADSVIVAIGQGAEPISSPGEKDQRGVVRGNPETFKTSAENLYVAGDFMTGPSTIIEAIASGRKAAERIACDLTGTPFREWVVQIQEAQVTDRPRTWDYLPRQKMPSIEPVSDRFVSVDTEVEQGYSKELSRTESQRCYLCYLHYEIDISRCIYCRYCIDVAPRDCIKLVEEVVTNEDGAIIKLVETTNWQNVNAVIIDNTRCIRCGECVRVCPMDCISVSKVELVQHMVQRGKD